MRSTARRRSTTCGSSTMSSDEFREVEAAVEPQLAAFRDKIYQNPGLFRRVEEV